MSHFLQWHPLMLLFVFESVLLIRLKKKTKKKQKNLPNKNSFRADCFPNEMCFGGYCFQNEMCSGADCFPNQTCLGADCFLNHVFWGKFISRLIKYFRDNKVSKLNGISNIKYQKNLKISKKKNVANLKKFQKKRHKPKMFWAKLPHTLKKLQPT